MNASVLISAILRQTTVLVAELATSGGVRAPLAHVADQVFLELARELESQGLSRKVTADMFGLALRSYQRKIQRLAESGTERGRTLWEAVYEFVQSREVVTRMQVLERFQADEEALVRGVLSDLQESGLVFATGPSQDTSFRAASDRELAALRVARGLRADELLWALVFRTGPVSVAALASQARIDPEEAKAALQRLVCAGRVSCEEGRGGSVYRTTRFLVPISGASGWEAAVFDHYHAVVRTICTKLRQIATSSIDDRIGGSTYSFEVWRDHPCANDVLTVLQRFRKEYSELRERVREYNQSHPKPKERQAVVVYAGQCVWDLDDEANESV